VEGDSVKFEHIVSHCEVSKVELKYVERQTCNSAGRSTTGRVSSTGMEGEEKGRAS
jgi:hypothetical protein